MENRNISRSVTLYFLPSPERLNYDSPSQLARSLVLSELTLVNHSIGHVIVVLEKKCGPQILEECAIAVTTQGNSEERKLLLKDQIGFGILFQSLAGRLESSSEIQHELASRRHSGKMKFVRMEVSEEAYLRMKEYSHQYHERSYEKFFGMINRPRFGEGAGCSAYALSYLEVAGLVLPSFLKCWQRTLLVPKSLVGGALTGKKVSFFKLLFSGNKCRWANSGEPHFSVTFWDPDLMFDWVSGKISQQGYDGHFEFRKESGAQGLWVDCREMEVPKCSFWLTDVHATVKKDSRNAQYYESNLVRKSG